MSISYLLKRFRLKIAFTFILVILESLGNLLFPLFIGFAINDLLTSKYNGLLYLGILGAVSLVLGAARRFYDTRIYSAIYTKIAPEMVEKEFDRDSSVSKINARATLLTEFIEFLENSLPSIFTIFISLIGTLFILLTINLNIFIACLIVLVIIIFVYGITSKKNFNLNKGFNDTVEKQVECLEKRNKLGIISHFKNLMRWNIKLSDLETVNFSFVWIAMIPLILYSIISAVNGGATEYGTVFSVIMYVFDFMGSSTTLPFHYQQIIRLREITERLK